MKKIVTIGELNVDFIPEQKACPLKDVTKFERVAGGAPGNVACAVGQLGGNVAMISQVGQEAFGTYIIETLQNCNVHTNYIFRTSCANTGLAFVSLDSTGNRDFSFYRNPSADLYLSENDITPEMFHNCGILHFCSVGLIDSPLKEAHKKAIALAREAGAIISFDPNVRLPLWSSPDACRDAILEFLPLADIVKISDDELNFILGIDDPRAHNLNCSLFIYTKGPLGAVAITKNQQIEVPGVLVDVVDTTGAGDSFIGSLLFQLMCDNVSSAQLSSLDSNILYEYLKFSNCYAAYTTTQKGAAAAMATMDQIQHFMKNIH